ncbi:hypothetical protein KJ980_03770 [Patescibacteria group bacterium]|nr:hypothetical protein [Patescibacteria group bacterium]MBU4017054.1 hypothetical protein [Patescibacteria group bacterium]MBU4098741.1 hypothetical protein [Patescibacteria group bacterium]
MDAYTGLQWYYYPLFAWSIMWTGIVLWRSARLHQRNWFVVFLIVHTSGILELIYLFYFAKKKLTIAEIKTWFRNMFLVKSR